MDAQGGKKHGQILKEQEEELLKINKQFLNDDDYDDIENLDEQLQAFAKKFLEIDTNHDGELDVMELKYMLEKLDQPKTHMEVKKMIAQVDSRGVGSLNYNDFVVMMIGKKNSVLKRILMFETLIKAQEPKKPEGPPEKKTLADLP